MINALGKVDGCKMVHRQMKSDVKIHGFKSGPGSDEKCWENGWFEHASESDGPLAKWKVSNK